MEGRHAILPTTQSRIVKLDQGKLITAETGKDLHGEFMIRENSVNKFLLAKFYFRNDNRKLVAPFGTKR